MIDIAVLASGSGTNLQVLIDDAEIRPHLTLVLSDNLGAGALERARLAGIRTAVVEFGRYADRHAFSEAVADTVEAAGAKFVVLAGFMRVLSPVFINRFPNRILNVHPSLLPAFPGAHAVEDVLEHGVLTTGATVHLVDEMVDHGPIIAQESVAVEPGDTPATLHARIQEVEHRIYPAVIRDLISGAVAEGKVKQK